MSGRRRPWAASRAVYSTPVIRTRSPAMRLSASASDSGGTTSLIPSGPSVTVMPLSPPRATSQRGLLVPVGVALDGDGHGQRGDVTRVGQHVDAERGRVAA